MHSANRLVHTILSQKSAFARTKEEFGGIDIVCNNAGIRNEKEWRKMVDINLVRLAAILDN